MKKTITRRLFNAIMALTVTGSMFAQYTWTLSNAGMPAAFVPVKFTKHNGDIYLAGSYMGIWPIVPKLLKSTDNGTTWTQITMSGMTGTMSATSLISTGSKLLYSGYESWHYYIYASTDNGLNWNISNTGINANYFPRELALAPNGDVYLAAGNYTNGAFAPKLLKSIDNGSTWTEIATTGLTATLMPSALTFVNNKLLLAGTGNGSASVYSSNDNGVTWTLSGTGIPIGCDVTDFAVSPAQEIYGACYFGNSSGTYARIIKSNDLGLTWFEISGLTGLNNLQGTSSIIYSSNHLLLGGSSSDGYVFKSSSPINTAGIKLDGGTDAELTFYPNPVSGILTVEMTIENIKALYEIKIYNNLGQLVKTETAGAEEKQLTLKTDDLPEGIYVLQLTSGTLTVSKRFVVSR